MSIQTQPQNPPVSPEIQQLIDLCRAVAGGAADRLPALEVLLQQAQQGLAPAWENFAKSIEAENEEFVTARKPIIDAVENGYQSYSQALEKIVAFLTQKKPDLLKEAADMLARDWPNLYLAIMSYETSVLTVGASKYGVINLFENLGKRVQNNTVPFDTFRSTVRGHQQFFEGVIKEIDASKEAKEPGIPERRAAAVTMIDLLKRLETMNPSSAWGEIQNLLTTMTSTLMEMEAAYNTYNFHALAETPTASPEANKVIHTAWGVRDGKFPPELLKGEAALYQEQVKKALETVQAATRLPAESEVLAEEIPKMMEAMEGMDEALEQLKTLADKPAELEAAVQQLTAAVERLNQSHQAVQKHNETYGKTMCPACQTYNQADHKTCEKCGRPLPQFAGREVVGVTDRPRDVIVTRSMKDLQDACEAYEKGQMTQDDFLAVLHRLEEKVRLAEFKLSQLKVPEIPDNATQQDRENVEEFLGYAADAIGTLGQGVGQCTAGLMKLERYAQEDQAGDLRDGLRDFVEGCQKLLQLEHIARAFVAALPPKEEEPVDGAAPAALPPDDGSRLA